MQKRKKNKSTFANSYLSGACRLVATASLLFIATSCQVNHAPGPEEFPTIPPQLSRSEEALLTEVQRQTFRYFWQGAEPHSGMARERYHIDDPSKDEDIVTTGGTGFGLMAILVGMERGFISKEEGRIRTDKIVNFLLQAPRFHGAWSHWMNGKTGEVIPFSPQDDGGDLVETAFLAQGILCARQYFRNGNNSERLVAQKLNQLWLSINWNFYRGDDRENVLFWHWSPTHEWAMNFRLRGYNESFITYILAASSPSYPAPPEVYHEGWADQGAIVEPNAQNPLPLRHQGGALQGGPLFWAHYSFLGLDPRKLSDRYANYGLHNLKHARLNYQHCVDNPQGFAGYGPDCWGLTASYSLDFYAAHSPQNDLGVISPTAALSSFPYTPKESMAALQFFHTALGDRLWGPYGPYDAFSIQEDWFPQRYLAIDQGPILIMIENYRTGLLWNLFMSCPEIQKGLERLGLSYGSS